MTAAGHPVERALQPAVIEMPHWRTLAVHAARTAALVSVAPMLVFYAAMSVAGLKPEVLATLTWYYLGLVIRATQRKPVLGAAALGAALLTVRTAVTFMTNSAFIYFLQPIAGTAVTAVSFAVSAVLGKPVLDRIAHDFCPLPPDLSARLRRQRFFSWLSVVWAVAYSVNAVGTLWLLTSASVGSFVLFKSVLSPAVTAVAIGASVLLFRFTVRDVRIVWGSHRAQAGARDAGDVPAAVDAAPAPAG